MEGGGVNLTPRWYRKRRSITASRMILPMIYSYVHVLRPQDPIKPLTKQLSARP